MPTRARLCLALLLCGVAMPALAEEAKPDDRVTLSLQAENWVTTSTARVVLQVDAAVAGSSAGSMREAMQKAVEGVVKAEWRLTGFSRSSDATGLERWNASYEARVPESALGGIHDTVKKASKAGMQLTVGEIAFDPTLAETEAAQAKLRTDIYKQANDQLTTLNTAIPGRQYRIGAIDFMPQGVMPPMPVMMARPMMGRVATMAAGSSGMAEADMVAEAPEMQRSQKIAVQAQVTFNALPPVAGK